MHDLDAFQARFAAMLGDDPLADMSPGQTVYRNTVFSALIEALAANYPVVGELVGPECFAALARDWLRDRRRPDAVLAGIGDGFPESLADFALEHDLPYLPEVARIERLRTEAHLMADDDWTVRGAHFATPAYSIWLAHHLGTLDLLDGLVWRAEHVCVERIGGAVSCRPMRVSINQGVS